jgi:hypothetical protein
LCLEALYQTLIHTTRTDSAATGGYVRGGNIQSSCHWSSSSSSDAHEFNVPKFNVDPMYQAEHERIDTENPQVKCQRYGLAPYGGPPRRIFFGSLVADENWDVFRMHAIEIYGIYHVAVFIEANTNIHGDSSQTEIQGFGGARSSCCFWYVWKQYTHLF